jgi:hypothetical protein
MKEEQVKRGCASAPPPPSTNPATNTTEADGDMWTRTGTHAPMYTNTTLSQIPANSRNTLQEKAWVDRLMLRRV